VHLSTGNYHQMTSKVYTDFGLMTSDADIGEDVHKMFQQLSGLGTAIKLKRLLQSPFTLHKGLLEKIEREIGHAQAGRPARIIAKMNALTDPQIIQALYQASQAGVRVDLIVRSTCCLRPGVPGVSESIRVRSIVGRFLEHTRIFYFLSLGEERCYCASADWMQRNLFRRVETCFPIVERRLVQRLLAEGLEPYLADNAQAWSLAPDGKYRRAKPGNQPRRAAQEILLERLCEQPELAPREESRVSTPAKRIAFAEAIEEKMRGAKRKQRGGVAPRARRLRRSHSGIVLEPIKPPARDEPR